MNGMCEAIYDLCPPRTFTDVQPVGEEPLTSRVFVCEMPTSPVIPWRLARLAEMTGRLPYKINSLLYSFIDNGCESERVLPDIEPKDILWDGFGEYDGLFSTWELSFAEKKPPFTNLDVALSDALDEESSARVERTIAAGITGWARHSLLRVRQRRSAHPDEASREFVESLTGGARTLGALDGSFRVVHSHPALETAHLEAAYVLARSGAAGEEARRLARLRGELLDVEKIVCRYVPSDTWSDGVSAKRIAEVLATSGVYPFIESYLVDGVPLADILA